jgi:hypothetical protein
MAPNAISLTKKNAAQELLGWRNFSNPRSTTWCDYSHFGRCPQITLKPSYTYHEKVTPNCTAIIAYKHLGYWSKHRLGSRWLCRWARSSSWLSWSSLRCPQPMSRTIVKLFNQKSNPSSFTT